MASNYTDASVTTTLTSRLFDPVTSVSIAINDTLSGFIDDPGDSKVMLSTARSVN